MERVWARADRRRRPAGFNGWRCPHPWYKVIPGVDLAAAARDKAVQETRNGRWYWVSEALERANFLDKKNRQVLVQILALKC